MKIVLYIATSLDGYIAGADDDMSWLDAFAESGTDYGYDEFYQSVDALVMGRRTYDWIVENSEWPYDKPAWVMTHRRLDNAPETVQTSDIPVSMLCETLDAQGYEQVWLVGGGQLVKRFLQAGRIDEFCMFIMPVLLGDGIPLFPSGFDLHRLNLRVSQSHVGGVMELRYEK